MSLEVSREQLFSALKSIEDPRLVLDCISELASMLPEYLYKLYITEQYFDKAYRGTYYKLTHSTISDSIYFIRKEDAYNFVRKNNFNEDFILTPSIFDARVQEHKPISGYYVERLKRD